MYVASINGTIYKLIDSSLSVTENNLTSVKVYPNPVTDELYISNSDNANPISNIEILDVQGKSILKETNKSQPITYINTNYLSSGLYFLKITNDSGSHFIHKLIKE